MKWPAANHPAAGRRGEARTGRGVSWLQYPRQSDVWLKRVQEDSSERGQGNGGRTPGRHSCMRATGTRRAPPACSSCRRWCRSPSSGASSRPVEVRTARVPAAAQIERSPSSRPENERYGQYQRDTPTGLAGGLSHFVAGIRGPSLQCASTRPSRSSMCAFRPRYTGSFTSFERSRGRSRLTFSTSWMCACGPLLMTTIRSER